MTSGNVELTSGNIKLTSGNIKMIRRLGLIRRCPPVVPLLSLMGLVGLVGLVGLMGGTISNADPGSQEQQKSISASNPTNIISEMPRLPLPELETLPNGLTIAWYLNPAIPVVDLSLVVRTGFKDDPAGKSGTAQLTSLVIDRGAGGQTSNQIAHSIELLGGLRFVAVDEDSFNIGVHGLAPDAESLLEILGRIALSPRFPENELKREKERLLARRAHLGSDESLGGLIFRRILTADTHYGRGPMLSAQEFEKIKREDVVRFHQKYFVPQNSILMVLGKVERPLFRKKIEEVLAPWKGVSSPSVMASYRDPRFEKLMSKKLNLVVLNQPELKQSQLRLGFKAPLLQAPEHASLMVVNALLSEQFTSRLNRIVRDELGLTYSIQSGFNYFKDYAEFCIFSSARSENMGVLIQNVIQILKKLKSGPISFEEVEAAKTYLIGGFPLNNTTLQSIGSHWLSGYLFGLPPNSINEVIPQIQQVTVSSVQEAVQKNFDLDRMLVVVSGHSQEIQKSIKASQLKPTQLVLMSNWN